jgi:uncharacterized protein (TIGR03067 family)
MRRGIVSVAVVIGCAAILPPVAAAPAPFQRSDRSARVAAREDRKKLQGTWYTAAISYSGGSTAMEDPDDTITYDGDSYVQRINGRVWQAGTFVIVDARASPRQIEYHCTQGVHAGIHFRSIYSIDGDRHRLCSDDGNDRRPKAFAGTSGFLRVTKRVRK